MPNRVVVHAYDLSQGMARAMSMQLMGKQIDAIYHTAIVVYGREFFYGGGIASAPPGQTHFGAPLEVIELGTTEVPEALFLEWLSSNAGRFRAEDYNLLRHNCNTFTDEAAQFLVGGGLPPHIARMIPEIMSSPMGAALAPMLENLSTQQQHQLGGHQPIGAGPAAARRRPGQPVGEHRPAAHRAARRAARRARLRRRRRSRGRGARLRAAARRAARERRRHARRLARAARQNRDEPAPRARRGQVPAAAARERDRAKAAHRAERRASVARGARLRGGAAAAVRRRRARGARAHDRRRARRPEVARVDRRAWVALMRPSRVKV